MKKPILLLTLLIATTILLNAQERFIARGATPGELYTSGAWYGIYGPPGPPFFISSYMAVFRITENGKKLTIQYGIDRFDFTTPTYTMLPMPYILADATPGVLYVKNTFCWGLPNDGACTSLYVSLDYGENWIFREENDGSHRYYTGSIEGLVYRYRDSGTNRGYRSYDYGNTFDLISNNGIMQTAETCFEECEFFSLSGRGFYHTFDCFENYINLTIDGEFAGGNTDVFRGGLPGEVYVTSWSSYGNYYMVSFSADTGHTFRHVYTHNHADETYESKPFFMSDREPGVFYILRSYLIEDFNPWGQHYKVCIEYFRDYGETLEAVFCHDVTKDYEYEEVVCNNSTYLEPIGLHYNSVRLHWSTSANSEFIRGYHVYRDNVRITNQLLTTPTYLDENLPAGNYEYFVRTFYMEGCVSDSSNRVIETVEVGVVSTTLNNRIEVYPNPTTGELTITHIPRWRGQGVEQLINNEQLIINNVEVFDVYGKRHEGTKGRKHEGEIVINISHLHAGVYFVKVTTEKGVAMRKVVKQ